MTRASRGISDIQEHARGNDMKSKSKSSMGKVARKSKASLGPAMSMGAIPGMKMGGSCKGYAKGGSIDGVAKKGKTKGKMC